MTPLTRGLLSGGGVVVFGEHAKLYHLKAPQIALVLAMHLCCSHALCNAASIFARVARRSCCGCWVSSLSRASSPVCWTQCRSLRPRLRESRSRSSCWSGLGRAAASSGPRARRRTRGILLQDACGFARIAASLLLQGLQDLCCVCVTCACLACVLPCAAAGFSCHRHHCRRHCPQLIGYRQHQLHRAHRQAQAGHRS